MEQFKDKVAVITGAATGMGRAFAQRCADEGMKVVLADIEEQALFGAARELESQEARVLAVPTNVAKADDIEALAQKTLDTFGAVHLLFNNAGVGLGGKIWEQTLKDWEWLMGVNLWGVVHGIRTFVPIMLEQNVECHIINNAGEVGLVLGPGNGSYRVSKHGVVALSGTLYHELRSMGAKVNVSVLCPGMVKTQLMDSDRNRPPELQDDPAQKSQDPEVQAAWQDLRQRIEEGMAPTEVADRVFEAIRKEAFYILTHPEVKDRVRVQAEDLLQDRNPT